MCVCFKFQVLFLEYNRDHFLEMPIFMGGIKPTEMEIIIFRDLPNEECIVWVGNAMTPDLFPETDSKFAPESG